MSAPAADHNAAKPIPHVPQASRRYKNSYNGFVYNIHTWLYDVSVFLFNILFTIFFREIKVRGAYNVPEVGVPTILVCAPHANQFIDPAFGNVANPFAEDISGKVPIQNALFCYC
ncbi:AIF_collapsed_G0031370.mRNA.1.CDS.1 [Saccharomyces cerevisiae]|nr:AIF_collapsed_G0031370.mRNA.1.CDS.1 [Saccharomyces cerevisiae]